MRASPDEFIKESNAIEDVYDYASFSDALAAWDYLTGEKEMTPKVILEAHRILMKRHLEGKDLGAFRTENVYVGGERMMNPASIGYSLANWCILMNQPTFMHEWKSLHIQYEKIHPFIDGNGRTGRLFMNWQRVKNNQPLIVIHEGEEQREYYEWFRG